MKIIILNGSPKGEYSITLQYVRFLEKQYPDHDYRVLHVAHDIKKLEKNPQLFADTMAQIKESAAGDLAGGSPALS